MEDTEFGIEIHDLQKSFGDVHAVRGLSFAVRRGEFFAFLGENGAGKSTTISVLCGLLSADAGTVKVLGVDARDFPSEVRRKLGVVFQSSRLDKALSVRDNLKFRAAPYGIFGADFDARLREVSRMLSLDEILSRPVGKLSGGQRRRVDMARALFPKPEILVLDEPTTGLDPQTRRQLWEVLRTLRREEKLTILLTTHYIEEAEDADEVLILSEGKAAAYGTPLALKNRYTGDFITLYGVDEARIASLGVPYEAWGEGYRLSVPNTAAATSLIVSHPDLFADYEVTKGRLEDVFLAVTGRAMQN